MPQALLADQILTSQPRPARAVATPQKAKKRWLTPVAIFSAAVLVLLLVGLLVPTERYITPRRGIGYALGIIGGSMMLLLLLYSARKHVRWLKFLGPTVSWFRYHMLLGVLGPLCILYHANFGLGATNSNVALFSMLTVAGSGLIGRYIYARIHHGLYGSKLSLGELKTGAEGLRAHSGAFGFLPQLVSRLESTENKLLAAGPHLPVLGIAKLAVVALLSIASRWQLRGYVRRGLRAAAKNSPVIAAERKRLRRTAFTYIDKRLAATRRVAGFQSYERLFSLWHALHIPLLFILIAAGIVHVIAVNVY
jgi:predicted small integral membrane protein